MNKMEDILDKFDLFTQKPVKYLTVQNDLKEDFKNLVKSLYDYTKSQEQTDKTRNKSALPELIVKDFDEEQIWQQIELQNSECCDQLVWDVATSVSAKNDLVFPVKTSQDLEAKLQEAEVANPTDGDDDPVYDDAEKQKRKPKKPKSHSKSSIVDDKFFKLNEMEKFLLNEEKKEGVNARSDSDDESINMFEDIDDGEVEDEEGGKDMMYTDFFGDEDNVSEDNDGDSNDDDVQEDEMIKKRDKKVRFAEQMSEDDADSDDVDDTNTPANTVRSNIPMFKNGKKSEFDLRQVRLQQQIMKLEEKMLDEAPWQLKGEVDAKKRPQNSLLQEVVDFDLTTRPPPIITEQTTVTLEDIIKRRIKDKAWDDVVRKEKPVDDQLAFRKPEVLDHSKSKLSLAQVYEAEYLKQKQALNGDNEDEKEPESHTKVREAMTELFSKLDALCHYHYTPKPPQAEVKIVTNTPAISMEEVAPVATSDAALLAPEEIKKKHKGDLMSKEERTQTDKNRERRKKKQLQRKKGQVTKLTDHRNTKKAVETNDKSLKTSKAFFQQLNDDATSLIKNKRNVKNKGQ